MTASKITRARTAYRLAFDLDEVEAEVLDFEAAE
jgi:hypothetical protein